MDALAKLQAEIAKKKKKSAKSGGNINGETSQKWKRKADVEAERKRQYLAEEASFDEAQRQKRRKQQEARDELNARERVLKEVDTEVTTDEGNAKREAKSHTEKKGDSTKNAKGAEDDYPPASVSKGPPLESDYCREDYVAACVRHYLSLWRQEVDGMEAEAKQTREGRAVVTACTQTVSWLKPLLKLLSRRQVKKDVLDGLRNIFAAVRLREYERANQVYLEQLAIGNAPWPMGATMVGIHARAAREKISEHKIAHVMNDEQTRKYIQCVKRLITVAERHYPTGEMDADGGASSGTGGAP